MVALIGHAVVWVAVIAILIAVYHVIRTDSAFNGYVFAGGALVRLVFGGAAFAISYYELPILKGLHTGKGFWTLAVDAEAYFEIAAHAARAGLATISDSDPSPMYLRVMALWMEGTGVTPASAVLFNVVCYAGTALLLAKVCRAGAAGTAALLLITFSPALLFVSTQALKDSFCVFLIVMTATGVSLWTDSFTRPAGDRAAAQWSGIMICLGLYAFAGIRAYFAILMLVSLVASSIWSVVVKPGTVSRLRILVSHSALVAVASLACVAGGGPYFSSYTDATRAALLAPTKSLAVFDAAREGFVRSGGATNFGEPLPDRSAPSQSVGARLKYLATGLAAMFVPISALKALSIVSFSGGRGLLFITDLDTAVLDLGLGVGLCLLLLHGPAIRLSPATVFVAVLAILTTVAMAYVVTNFGTLFRLRLLASTPLFLVPAFALYNEPWPRLSSIKTKANQ